MLTSEVDSAVESWMVSKEGMEVQFADVTKQLKVLFYTSDGRKTKFPNRKYAGPLLVYARCWNPQNASGLLLTDRQCISARYQIKNIQES